MSYPQGYLYQPSASLALYSCPAYSTSVISGPRTDELGRSSSGSAFSPYAGSTAFTAPSPGYNSHLQYGTDPAAAAAAAFTSYVGSPYEHPPAMAGSLGYHPYAAPLGSYPYGDPAYRKNATRDATATLKAWLNEHRKNPYPTKGEKIMLAIITKMTLTQVSTWFANARRRLKKENKMTWSPKNKAGEERKEDGTRHDGEFGAGSDGRERKSCKEDKELRLSDVDDLEEEDEEDEDEEEAGKAAKGRPGSLQEAPGPGTALPGAPRSACSVPEPCRAFPCPRAPSAAPAALAPPPPYASPEKPRIWSLARTAGANAARRGSPEGRGTEEGGGAAGELPPAAEAPFRSSAFSPQPVPRSCASHRGQGQPCQYAAGEGFGRGGGGGPGGAEPGGTCLERLRTAFRPVLKR